MLRSTRRVWAAAVLLLLAMAAEVTLTTRQESPSWDEGDHIYAGYMNWKTGDYSLNPEHPPLVKLVATLPLLGLDLKVAPRQGRYFKDEAYFGGRELLFRNDPKYGGRYGPDTLLFRVRMAAMSFGLMLALLVFLAGREMFGDAVGLMAMTLYVFDPSVVAMTPFVATDTGASWGFFAVVYTFYRFIKQMTWQRAVVCGVALGLALTTKHSTVALLPLLVLLAAGELGGRWWAARHWPGRAGARLAAGLVAIAALALLVLWAVYGFRYAMRPSGVLLPPLAGQMKSLSPLMQRVIGVCVRFHLAPESYLYGLVDVLRVGIDTPTFFLGQVYAHGVRSYFPVLLSLKWSVGTLGLLLVAGYAFLRGRLHRPREVFFLMLPVVFFLAVAIAGPLNIGVRHILPIFPFVFVLAAAGAVWMARQRRGWAVAVATILALHVGESLWAYPNYVPFGNALWGGPAKTHLYFSDSATDWAQQLKQTKQWTEAHGVKDCWFAYFAAPYLQPSDYGIPCRLLPTPDTGWADYDLDVPPVVHGPLLVSYGDLNGFEYGTKVRNMYQSLMGREPDAVIADGVAVFYGDFSLPEGSAAQYARRSRESLKKDPQAAVALGRRAVELAPQGFDANMALGDALAAVGSKAGARAAYRVTQARLAEMEPSAREQWVPEIAKKLADNQ